jgi:hypothetical protein
MANSGHAQAAIADSELAQEVAKHKSMFFAEKDSSKNPIDYFAAINRQIQIVPVGGALKALKSDYEAMLDDGLLSSHQPNFDEVISICAGLQDHINFIDR